MTKYHPEEHQDMFNDLKGELNRATSPDLMYSKLREEKLAIYLSEELLSFVDSERDNFGEEHLIAETVKTRVNLTQSTGYIIPKVVFKDDEALNCGEFSIRIRGVEVFRGIVYPGYKSLKSQKANALGYFLELFKKCRKINLKY